MAQASRHASRPRPHEALTPLPPHRADRLHHRAAGHARGGVLSRRHTSGSPARDDADDTGLGADTRLNRSPQVMAPQVTGWRDVSTSDTG